MTDSTPPPDIPDVPSPAQLLARIADLLAGSSLGELPPEAEPYVDNSPDRIMVLRERIRHRTELSGDSSPHSPVPSGSWNSATETKILFSEIGGVFPEPDGTVKFDFGNFGGRYIYAKNIGPQEFQVLKLTASEARLPGGSQREHWTLFVATEQTCRSSLTIELPHPDLELAEVAILWRLEHPEQALMYGLTRISHELVQAAIENHLHPMKINPLLARPAALQFSLERAVESALTAQGLACECAVQLYPNIDRAPTMEIRPLEIRSMAEGKPSPSRVRADGRPSAWLAADADDPDLPWLSKTLADSSSAKSSEITTQEKNHSVDELLQSMTQLLAIGEGDTLIGRMSSEFTKFLRYGTPQVRATVQEDHLLYAFAALQEALRLDYGLDSITAEGASRQAAHKLFQQITARNSPARLQLGEVLLQVALAVFYEFPELAEIYSERLRDSNSAYERNEPTMPFPSVPAAYERIVLSLSRAGLEPSQIAESMNLTETAVLDVLRKVVERRRNGRYEYAGADWIG